VSLTTKKKKVGEEGSFLLFPFNARNFRQDREKKGGERGRRAAMVSGEKRGGGHENRVSFFRRETKTSVVIGEGEKGGGRHPCLNDFRHDRPSEEKRKEGVAECASTSMGKKKKGSQLFERRHHPLFNFTVALVGGEKKGPSVYAFARGKKRGKRGLSLLTVRFFSKKEKKKEEKTRANTPVGEGEKEGKKVNTLANLLALSPSRERKRKKREGGHHL